MRIFKQPFLFVAVALVTIILTSIPSRAQMKFGLFGGQDYAGAAAQGSSGYVVGLAYESPLIGPLSLLTETYVVKRTFKDATTIPSGSPNAGNMQSWIEELTSLQTPILLKITPVDGTFAPFVFIGPNIGFKLSSASMPDSTGTSPAIDQNSLYNFLDISIQVGGGIGVRIFPILWLVGDVRYAFGLTDVYKSYNASSANNLKSRDLIWTGGLAIGF